MSQSVRILLINAINTSVENETRYPGLGLGYLVSYARKYLPGFNISFKIIDRRIRETTQSFKPHLVGISSVSQNFGTVIRLCGYFDSLDIPVILGGIHITSLPECLPKNVPLACLGESEATFVRVVKLFVEDKLKTEYLRDIPGIAFREADTVRITPPAEQLDNLDFLPMPARDLLRIKSHTYVYSSRGCPYRCIFCSSTRFWNQVRFFSADYVIDEIEHLKKHYKVQMISFLDDLFIADTTRLEEILKGLEKKGLIGKIKFTCSCRANLVDKEIADLLSRMGVVSVGMGLESGNQATLRYLKQNVDVEQNSKAIETLKNAGIYTNGSFIIGSPQETQEQILETYRFIKKSRLDLFDISLLTPLPNTPLWQTALEKKLVSTDMNWNKLNMNPYHHPENVLSLSDVLEKKHLIQLYKKFRRLRFLRNLSKIWQHPMRVDIPKMMVSLFKEYSWLLIRRGLVFLPGSSRLSTTRHRID
jgi:anaerobic magnesium-protoporphyrin IX monomethyl ester cyclase